MKTGFFHSKVLVAGKVVLLASVTLALVSLSACAPWQPAHKVDQQLVAEPDPVGLRLASAVDKASAALQTLASVEQARTPAVAFQTAPVAPKELRRVVSVEWVGPIEPLARRLSERAGYTFRVNGDMPAAPVVVNVTAKQKSVVEVLRDIGLQAGSRADIAVDTDQKLVELNYAPTSGG